MDIQLLEYIIIALIALTVSVILLFVIPAFKASKNLIPLEQSLRDLNIFDPTILFVSKSGRNALIFHCNDITLCVASGQRHIRRCIDTQRDKITRKGNESININIRGFGVPTQTITFLDHNERERRLSIMETEGYNFNEN